MKRSELRQIIREEIENLKEDKTHELKLFGLIEDPEGRFSNKTPLIYIQAPNFQSAERLADEYTNGEYSKYKNRMFNLTPKVIKIYK
jgi:hypothetical protein